MSFHEDQLKHLEEKEKKYWPLFSRLKKFNKALDNLNVISTISAIVITIIFFILLFKYVSIDDGWAGIILFYGGIFFGTFLKTGLDVVLNSLIHNLYNISKSEFRQFNDLQAEIISKKSEIKRQIEIQQREERARVMRTKETLLGEMLENLITGLTNKTILKSEATILKGKLELDYQSLGMYGLQIHRAIYYTNRFDKINQLLNDLSSIKNQKEPIISPEKQKNGIPPINKPELQLNKDYKSPPIAPKKYIPVENQEIIKETESKVEEKVDKDISELFNSKPKSIQKTDMLKSIRVNPKIDFENLNITRHSIGLLGEEFVYKEEIRKLKEGGMIKLSEMVQWVSKESDSHGYDIKSFHPDGSYKFIEVKTTIEGAKTPFYLSELELDTLKQLHPKYIICRVYNFDIKTGKGLKYWVSKTQLESYFDLQPTSYKANPKPNNQIDSNPNPEDDVPA